MSERAENAWVNAEQRCFDHLISALGALDGVSGHKGKLPRKTGNLDEANPDLIEEWSFAITGEGGGNINDMISPSERPKKSWSSGAIFKGRFFDRKQALRVCGRLIDALPVELVGVQYFGPQDGVIPEITEDVFFVGDTGYELDGWTVELPLQVVFGVTSEQEIG